jgi:thymidylate synthase (FAD)
MLQAALILALINPIVILVKLLQITCVNTSGLLENNHKGNMKMPVKDSVDNSIQCLDHGFVRLCDSMGNDLSVARAARVSYDAAWRAGEDEGSDAKLINYLWKNKHTTPFESVQFTFEVKAPIFVFRQWHRHRTWSYNELSGRYKELPDEFYLPDFTDVGEQSKDNKQGRQKLQCYGNRMHEVHRIDRLMQSSFAEYKKLLSAGWPRELARIVLPLSTYSHMFASVNLLNLLKFLSLRDDEHAQYEMQVYAKALKELIKGIVPICLEAWENDRRRSIEINK